MVKIEHSQLLDGVWTATVSGTTKAPNIVATLRERPLEDVNVVAGDAGTWVIKVPVPKWAMSDGVHNFLVSLEGGEQIGSFAIMSGTAIADDLRSEVTLLRAELDMLKKAFRRHRLEVLGET